MDAEADPIERGTIPTRPDTIKKATKETKCAITVTSTLNFSRSRKSIRICYTADGLGGSRLAGVLAQRQRTPRHRQFHAVDVREIPVSGGLKVWRFEIVADPAAKWALEPEDVEGFDTGGAAFTARIVC